MRVRYSYSHWHYLILLCVVIHGNETQNSANQDIGNIFKTNAIIPDVIDEEPNSQLTAQYGNVELNPGDSLTPEQTKNAPQKLVWFGQAGKSYTVVMLDPDAISRRKPIFRSWLHWLVVNIPGNSIASGEVKSPYKGPGPPKGTGFHRYVLLAFEQLGENLTINEDYDNNRSKFSIKNFIKKYNLSSAPIAGNFYLAQNSNQ